MQAYQEVPVNEAFPVDPGYFPPPWSGPARSIEVPEDQFPMIVERLKSAGVKSETGEVITAYHGEIVFKVMDPMGQAIEISYNPEGAGLQME